MSVARAEPYRVVLEDHVLFTTSHARVKPVGRSIISRLAQQWREHPEWRIRIEGHADQRGSSTFNQWLSEQRASRVARVLEQAGIPLTQIEIVGYGGTRLRSTGTSADQLASNRRVEFVIERDGTQP
jgi:outer membrane protein OmpA-like peptidoglycan-associated protein